MDGSRDWRRLAVRTAVCALAALVAWGAVSAVAGPIMYPVWAPDGVTQVGWISVDTDGNGIKGSFQSIWGNPPSLQAAAQKLGEDHFNWFQVVLEDNNPPQDSSGNPCVPPYTDPPHGGYYPPGHPDRQWADRMPWYYDEYAPLPPWGSTWNEDYLRESNESLDTLGFLDYPGGPVGSTVKFATWLVSLYADGSVHRYYEGFTWTWSNTAANPRGAVTISDDLLPADRAWDYTIPEPATCVLAGVGFVTLVISRRRRRAA